MLVLLRVYTFWVCVSEYLGLYSESICFCRPCLSCPHRKLSTNENVFCDNNECLYDCIIVHIWFIGLPTVYAHCPAYLPSHPQLSTLADGTDRTVITYLITPHELWRDLGGRNTPPPPSFFPSVYTLNQLTTIIWRPQAQLLSAGSTVLSSSLRRHKGRL